MVVVIVTFRSYPNFCGVDISSGVEDPQGSGKKSLEKISAFIDAVETSVTGKPAAEEMGD